MGLKSGGKMGMELTIYTILFNTLKYHLNKEPGHHHKMVFGSAFLVT